jgi:hypothetical protein
MGGEVAGQAEDAIAAGGDFWIVGGEDDGAAVGCH